MWVVFLQIGWEWDCMWLMLLQFGWQFEYICYWLCSFVVIRGVRV